MENELKANYLDTSDDKLQTELSYSKKHNRWQLQCIYYVIHFVLINHTWML